MVHADLQGHVTETSHMTQRQMTGDQDIYPVYMGKVVSYDPKTHYVQVVNPGNSNFDSSLTANDPVTPVQTDWMPLATGICSLGKGQNPLRNDIPVYGSQFTLFGGAALSNFGPGTGEQVLVCHVNSDIGAGFVACAAYNDQAPPPGSQPIPVSGVMLNTGEQLMVTPAGIILHLDKKANLNIYTMPNPNITDNTTANLMAILQGGIKLQSTKTPDLNYPEIGDTDISCDQDFNVSVIRDINETAQRDINQLSTRDTVSDAGRTNNLTANVSANIAGPVVTVTGPIINVGANAELLFPLLTSVFGAWAAVHTHGVIGGVTTAPLVPAPIVYPGETVALAGG